MRPEPIPQNPNVRSLAEPPAWRSPIRQGRDLTYCEELLRQPGTNLSGLPLSVVVALLIMVLGLLVVEDGGSKSVVPRPRAIPPVLPALRARVPRALSVEAIPPASPH